MSISILDPRAASVTPTLPLNVAKRIGYLIYTELVRDKSDLSSIDRRTYSISLRNSIFTSNQKTRV